MKKLLLLLWIALSLASCTKDENGNPCWTCIFQSSPPQDYCGFEPGRHVFHDSSGNVLTSISCKLK